MKRRRRNTWPACGLALALAGAAAAAECPAPAVIFVAGAPGEALYASNLVRQAALWSQVCAQAGAAFVTVGLATHTAPDREIGRASCRERV